MNKGRPYLFHKGINYTKNDDDYVIRIKKLVAVVVISRERKKEKKCPNPTPFSLLQYSKKERRKNLCVNMWQSSFYSSDQYTRERLKEKRKRNGERGRRWSIYMCICMLPVAFSFFSFYLFFTLPLSKYVARVWIILQLHQYLFSLLHMEGVAKKLNTNFFFALNIKTIVYLSVLWRSTWNPSWSIKIVCYLKEDL